MGRWHDLIGFSVSTETESDIYTDVIVERKLYGTAKSVRVDWSNQSNSTLNDLRFNVQITVNADEFTMKNYSRIKWIMYSGEKYRVSSITPQSNHRIVLSLGGVWNAVEN